MMKTALLLQAFALTFGAALSFSYAECLSWDELLAEESVIEVNIARRATMFVGYLNPPQLGVCFLGEDFYNIFIVRLVKEQPNRHFFWIGGPHSLDLVDTASRTSMLHEGEEFYFDLATKLSGPRSFPGIEIEFLLSFQGEIDFFEPVTIYFTPFMGGTFSKEYWLPEKYLDE
ncbi:MAG: hypothetical protein O6826_03260 [Acidobacteria bacterium]|nr:hypothetical protein [Acidobacteriota bacterium]